MARWRVPYVKVSIARVGRYWQCLPATLGFPPDLPALVSNWTADEFVRTLRTGRNPLGGLLGPQMPWQDFSRAFSDDELAAIYNYLRSLDPLLGPVPPR